MTVSTRLKGNSGLFLTLKKGAAAPVAYADDVKKWDLSYDPKDDDDLTFSEAAAGVGYNATLKLTAIVSADAGSLFAFLEANPAIDLVVDFGPYGNAAATVTKPHYQGTASIELPPGFSSEAATASKAKGAEFEVELKFSTVLTRVTA